jgi:hypothetical protein
MKKLFTILCSLIAVAGFAQKNSGFYPSTAIKWNPESLFLGKIGLQGEYNFSPRHSVTFGIGIPVDATTTFTSDADQLPITLKTFSVMGGYRMYLGKSAMKGFYFEPYVKYVKNDGYTKYTTNDNSSTSIFDLTSNYSGFGLGAQLGVQFLVAKHVTFDIFLVGPEANLATHTAVLHDLTNIYPWTNADAQSAIDELRDRIKSIPVMGSYLNQHTTITPDQNSKTISSDFSGVLPGFRTGLSVGYRF